MTLSTQISHPVLRLSSLAVVGSLLAIAACGSDVTPSTSPIASADASQTEEDQQPEVPLDPIELRPFVKVPVHFTGAENRREVDVDASFPEAGSFSSIALHLELSCPPGNCDAYDRFGTLGLVRTQDDGSEHVIEIARFITPFGVGGAWDYDLTDLRPLLAGDVKLRVFIDTWVGPGHVAGAGWLFSTTFTFTPGTPEREAVDVVPIWTNLSFPYGDPERPIPSSVPTTNVSLPSGASSFALRSFVTGHGQGNSQNCAEFCPKNHTLTAGTTEHTQRIWRTDCAKTGAPNQKGTWTYSRAGWCPGADVKPWTVDVTDDVAANATTLAIGYDVEAYENTCRPAAADEGGNCSGCTLSSSCDFDGGMHTEPNYRLSTLLIAYR